MLYILKLIKFVNFLLFFLQMHTLRGGQATIIKIKKLYQLFLPKKLQKDKYYN